MLMQSYSSINEVDGEGFSVIVGEGRFIIILLHEYEYECEYLCSAVDTQ